MQFIRTFIFITLAIPTALMANVGFECKKLNLEISRESVNEIMTLVIRNTSDRSTTFNTQLALPAANTLEAYQDRVGTYYGLMAEAQLHFPYLPGPLHIGHVMRSTALYKKGFKAFEGQSEKVELPKMYCKALQEAITKY